MSTMEIRAASKSYGAVRVLENVDLMIDEGEFIVLVGPSGCGKSTLLRMIAGLEDITSGEIRIGGELVNDLPPKARDIAMVFQSYALYPHMTVADNMSYSLRLRRTDKATIGDKVRAASAKLGLDQFLARKPKALSGGQRQRVAMGRAIVRQPKAFLFDEPLSNLDARLREQMRAEIRKLHQQIGATSIYVTHDQVEAMTLADRIVAMHGGHIQQVGTPLDLYDRPANLFVAGFIGSPGMNLLPARIEGGALRLEDGVKLPFTPEGVTGKFTLGIRPEHVTLTDKGGLQAAVELIEPTGHGIILHLLLGEAAFKVLTHDRQWLNPGEYVGLSFPPDMVHLFDENGQRIEG